MKSKTIRFITFNALIAALYVAVTYGGSPASYGYAQYRMSEALNVFCIFTPAAIPGVTLGCFIGNILSPYGIIDMISGSLTTLIAAVLMYLFRNIKVFNFPALSMLMPAVANGIVIGAVISYIDGVPFWITSTGVAAGEIAVMFTLGAVLYYALKKAPQLLDFANK